MSRQLHVVGLDPSMSNFGMVRGYFDLNGPDLGFHPQTLSLIETKPIKDKSTYKNSQDLERAQHLQKEVLKFVEPVSLITCEIPVGSQSARAMANYGTCIGIIASLQEWPMIQVMPSDVKKAVTGSKTATKADMIAWATETHPELNWLTHTRKGQTTYNLKNEHLADALATIYAAKQTPQFKMFVQTLTSFMKETNL